MVNLEQMADLVREVKISYNHPHNRPCSCSQPTPMEVKILYDPSTDSMTGDHLDQGWFAEETGVRVYNLK